MAEEPKSWSAAYAEDPTLYLYTSLTAGSSHIITATSRLETILKANKIPFRAIDVATDDKARMLWGRRSKGRKLPGLVKQGEIVGDLEQIEEWNEYGELKMQIGNVPNVDTPPTPFPSTTTTATKPAFPPAAPPPTNPITTTGQPTAPPPPKPGSSAPHVQIKDPPVEEKKEDRISLTLRQAGEEAASKAKDTTRASLRQSTASRLDVDQHSPSATEPKRESAAEKSSRIEETKEEREKPELPETGGEAENRAEPSTGRRRSVVPAPEIEGSPKRPSLPEVAAVSSSNFRAENAETLGLVEHHRGSIVSATSQEEKESVTRDLRKSISGAPAATVEDEEEAKEKEVKGPEDSKEKEAKGQGESTQKQDAKAAEKAGASVAD